MLAPLFIETPPSRSTGPPCICRRHLVSAGVEAGGVDDFRVSIFRVSRLATAGQRWAGCDARPAISYGPIRQLVSEQGWGVSHCGNAAPKPTTPKPNAARMMNFAMWNSFE